MPRTFVIVPEKSNSSNSGSGNGKDKDKNALSLPSPAADKHATVLQKMTSYLTRQKEKALDLVWER